MASADFPIFEMVMNVVGQNVTHKDTVNIVSGLPRSGTSMMMQILDRAGIPSFTDQVRKKDIKNPLGYFELEAVKDRYQYDEWVGRAKGKTAKVVSRFIPFLPATYCYNIVFMRRDISSIVKSQQDMAAHFSRSTWSQAEMRKLEGVYQTHVEAVLAWIANRPNMRLHQVQYEKVIENPLAELTQLADFFGQNILSISKMVQAVDADLDHSQNVKSG